MTNAQASEAPFFGRGTQSFPATDASRRPGAGHGRRNLVLGLAAVSVAAVTLGGVQYARVSSQDTVATNASKLAAGVGAAQAYQQNGSMSLASTAARTSIGAVDGIPPRVFTEQVPTGAVAADQSALGVGGVLPGSSTSRL